MYIKFKCDWFDNRKEYDTYIEVKDGYAARQIMKNDKRYIASNREDSQMEFFLAEGEIKVSEIEGVDIIDKLEFENIWNEHLKRLYPKWVKIKETFIPDMTVEGKIKVIYPQGIILEVSNNVIGVVNYDECIKNSEWKSIYPSNKVKARIKGYDEENMWLILEDAKIIK